MHNYQIRIYHMVILICLGSLLIMACDDRPSSDQSRESVVVSRKVMTQTNAPQKKAVERAPVEPRQHPAETSANIDVQTVRKPSTVESVQPETEKSTQMTESGSKPTSPVAALLKEEKFYNPAGKIDPFVPLYKEKKAVEPKLTGKGLKIERRIPKTPLEKINLSQLKLAAILRSENENRALVEEASGKGYIIKKGTYIGTKSGRVVEILRDKVIIEEQSEDALGNISLQKRELKLQKAFGEE